MLGAKIAKTFVAYASHVLAGTAAIVLFPLLLFLPATLHPILLELLSPVIGLFGEPFFPLRILLALWLGWHLNNRFGHRFARWVWILPAIYLAYTIATWTGHLYSTLSYWEDVRNELFGSGNSSTERVYQFSVTLPFYTSVAYSIGAHFGYRRWLRRNGHKQAPEAPVP